MPGSLTCVCDDASVICRSAVAIAYCAVFELVLNGCNIAAAVVSILLTDTCTFPFVASKKGQSGSTHEKSLIAFRRKINYLLPSILSDGNNEASMTRSTTLATWASNPDNQSTIATQPASSRKWVVGVRFMAHCGLFICTCIIHHSQSYPKLYKNRSRVVCQSTSHFILSKL